MSESLFRACISWLQQSDKEPGNILQPRELLAFQLSCTDSQGQTVCLASASLHLPHQTRPAITGISSSATGMSSAHNTRFQVQAATGSRKSPSGSRKLPTTLALFRMLFQTLQTMKMKCFLTCQYKNSECILRIHTRYDLYTLT